MNYLPLEKAAQKLNIPESELLVRKALKDIEYSKKKDKYNIDSILQTRTMTLGIDKYFNEIERKELISQMKSYHSLKMKLFKEITKGTKFNTNGTDRLHRKITKDINPLFTNLIADTALADAQGVYQSSMTWKFKYETNLKASIEKLEIKMKQRGLIKKKYQQYSKSLLIKKNKLKKSESKKYKSIWFGGKHLKGELKDKLSYENSRLELFIQGTLGKGNQKIGINFSNCGTKYNLRVLNKNIEGIKLPSSHRKTFSLVNFNRQSSRISMNKKGKLILNITYSYIKPIKLDNIDKSKGTIGIDIGPKEIAVAFVKNDGNPMEYLHYNIGNLLDSREEEKKRQISKILEELIEKGIEKGFYHVTIENLDNLNFKKTENRKLNRILTKFPKTIFEDIISSKCARKGIKIKKIHPAYTSIIGIFKYSNRDNLSPNHNSKSKDLSAALVIGRRGLGFVEKPIISIRVFNKIVSIPIHVVVNYPEEELTKKQMGTNNYEHLWKKLTAKFKTVKALTEHICVDLLNSKSNPNNTLG